MFIRIRDREELENHNPEFTIISAPDFHAVPELDGTHSEAFIIVNFAKKLVLIGGTYYAGEIKKSVFTILNYYLPQREVLSMHCAANAGQEGTWPSFSASPAPARPPSPPTRTATDRRRRARLERQGASSTSRGAATPRSSA